MKITFLGTSGWFSSKMGLTPCVLIETKNEYIVLDAGEGIQDLDKFATDVNKPISIFISHFHLDHVYGFHLFAKFNFPQGLKIFGKPGTKKTMGMLIDRPFSMNVKDLNYPVEFFDVDEGKHKTPVEFECRLLPHPDPSMGYRFHIENKVITYCTDTGPHENVVKLARDSDVLILECAYLPGEEIAGWAHMNPEKAATAALDANAGKLYLMHFDGYRYSTMEKRKEAARLAQKTFKNTIAAVDGLSIII